MSAHTTCPANALHKKHIVHPLRGLVLAAWNVLKVVEISKLFYQTLWSILGTLCSTWTHGFQPEWREVVRSMLTIMYKRPEISPTASVSSNWVIAIQVLAPFVSHMGPNICPPPRYFPWLSAGIQRPSEGGGVAGKRSEP